VIHLNRAQHNGKGRENSSLKFEEKIDLGLLLLGSPRIYLVKAVFCQLGSAMSGHIAKVKHGETWTECSDDKLKTVEASNVFCKEIFGGDGFVATTVFYTCEAKP
jgi:ubiquitin C-terminal hydrolase